MRRRSRVLTGKTWMITRRVTRRHFVLTPDEQGEVGRIVLYLLGYYCRKFGLRLHAVCVMSTHIHYVVTDTRGVRPKFTGEFHRVLANCLKAFRGWPEEVWNKSKPSEQELLTDDAILAAIAYVIANPVQAGAVRYHQDWPGLTTRPTDVGRREETVKRPSAYLRDFELFPETVDVVFEMPAMVEAEMPADVAQRKIAIGVRQRESEALAESKKRGLPFLGRRRVLRQMHTKRASSYEEFGSMDPRFMAAGDAEVARAHIDTLRQWHLEYDRALALWCAGKRQQAVFPPGTWWMVVHHGARVRPPP